MLVVGGNETDFWHDAWCGDVSLCEKFPGLFVVCNQQQKTVKEMHDSGWNLTFRRWLDPSLQNQLRVLKYQLLTVALGVGADRPIWKFTKSRKFTVKSLYSKLSAVGVDRSFKQLWKARIPLKIKIWLWLIWHNAIATKDNMRKRNWDGNYTCSFCLVDESISHLFFHCPMATFLWSNVCQALGTDSRHVCFSQYFWWIANLFPCGSNIHIVGVAALCWAIWKTRNKVCFEGKFPSSPVAVICHTCAFLHFWAGLQNENDRAILQEGADRIQQVAMQAQQMAPRISTQRIAQQEDGEIDEDVTVN
jgi:hypothetical protein